MKIIFPLTIMILALIFSCTRNVKSTKIVDPQADSLALVALEEAREDSMDFARSILLQNQITNSLSADNETAKVEAELEDDAADDPAIWYNKRNPADSRILGTNKKAGLYVYDLEGKVLQYSKSGMINNVDVRDGFKYNGKEVALVAGSNRSNNSITLFYIDYETASLSDSIKNIPSGVDEVYGVCMYNDLKKKEYYVFVNGKGGEMEQWLIKGGNTIEAKLVRAFGLPSQPEGMVASDLTSILYLGIEEEGIFSVKANSFKDTLMYKIPESDSTNHNIVYDIEGLAVFNYEGKEYLIASSQGNFSYALFKLKPELKYLSSFTLKGSLVDGVEETDGLDINTHFFNDNYPSGILVFQDGYNFDGDSLQSQNFKYLSFEKIIPFLK